MTCYNKAVAAVFALADQNNDITGVSTVFKNIFGTAASRLFHHLKIRQTRTVGFCLNRANLFGR